MVLSSTPNLLKMSIHFGCTLQSASLLQKPVMKLLFKEGFGREVRLSVHVVFALGIRATFPVDLGNSPVPRAGSKGTVSAFK